MKIGIIGLGKVGLPYATVIAEKGYDEVYGARELSRLIQEEIKKPIAEELIFGKISKGGHVSITLKENKINFDFSEKEITKKVLV